MKVSLDGLRAEEGLSEAHKPLVSVHLNEQQVGELAVAQSLQADNLHRISSAIFRARVAIAKPLLGVLHI